MFIFTYFQGLFVPFARVGSGDLVRVLHLFHNEYTIEAFIVETMYSLSLPNLMCYSTGHLHPCH